MPNFLDLPREIRDAIYAPLLSAPNGLVHISGRNNNAAASSHTRIVGRIFCRGTDESVQKALLLVNKQISTEAAKHLYSNNIFVPSSPLSQFVAWLKTLTDDKRSLIRHLEFRQRTFMPLLFDNTAAWTELHEIIQGSAGSPPMRLQTVAVHVPIEFKVYVPSPSLIFCKALSNAEQFCWPYVKFFLALLMTGKTAPESPCTINQLKLIIPTFGGRDIPKYQQPLLRPLSGPDAVDLEDLEAVRILRIPRHPEDEDGELAILLGMKESGMKGRFTKYAWRDWYASEAQTSRERLDFQVRWQPHKEAEVLILD